MYAVFIFGMPVERLWGSKKFIIYFKISKKSLFANFYLIDQNIAKTEYSFYKFLKSKPKLILIKLLRFFMPWYKSKEWWFMMKYYLSGIKKNYSATCLFLKKENNG